MTLTEWVHANRELIDSTVHDFSGFYPFDDDDREDWVLNDEVLYRWAEEEGVDFNE